MRIMLSAFAATILIAVVANSILQRSGFSAAEQTVSQDVRLD